MVSREILGQGRGYFLLLKHSHLYPTSGMTFRNMEPVRVFPIESDSTPGKEYYVTEWPTGSFTCTCPSFLYSTRQRGKDILDRDCKHTDRVRAAVPMMNEVYTPDTTGVPVRTAVEEAVVQRVQKQKDNKIKQLESIDPRIKGLISQMLSKAR